MNAEDAVLIAIASHTNAYLRRGSSFRLFHRDPVAQAIGDMRFTLAAEDMAEREIATGIEGWAAWLKKENCSGLRLSRGDRHRDLPERVATAFANAGSWMIESLMPDDTSGFWSARWDNDKARRWRTSLACIAKLPTDPAASLPLDTALAALIKALEDIHAFAVGQNRRNFADIFLSALKQARDADRMPSTRGFWDTGPLTRKAQKALDAAQSAHVFGGMGSWNDIGCEDQDREVYELVSATLYQAMNDVMEAAVNSHG